MAQCRMPGTAKGFWRYSLFNRRKAIQLVLLILKIKKSIPSERIVCSLSIQLLIFCSLRISVKIEKAL